MAELAGLGKPWWAAYPIMRKNAEELERENAELRSKLELLCDTIDAHEIESHSCDRDGEIYCDCLRNNAKLARAAIDAGLNHIDDSTEKEAQP